METLSMPLVDTHAHLADEAFSETMQEVITRAQQAGVEKILCVGTSAKSSQHSIDIAHRFANVYASVGIHPNYAHQASEQDWMKIQTLVTQPKVVALGKPVWIDIGMIVLGRISLRISIAIGS